MRHRKNSFKVRRFSEHRKAMLANLASSIITSGRVETTLTKAKEARRIVEKAITLGTQGTLHARRQARKHLRDKDTVNYLFEQVAPQFQNRPGGYTRMYKMGPRRGDGTEIALIELVNEPVSVGSEGDTAGEETEPEQTDAQESS